MNMHLKPIPTHRPEISMAMAGLVLPAQGDLAVLLVDPSPDLADEVSALLRRRGIRVQRAADTQGARAALARDPLIGVVLANVRLLDGDGQALAVALLNGDHALPLAELVLISGYRGAGDMSEVDLGLLQEPLRLRDVAVQVGRALGRAAVRRTARPAVA